MFVGIDVASLVPLHACQRYIGCGEKKEELPLHVDLWLCRWKETVEPCVMTSNE